VFRAPSPSEPGHAPQVSIIVDASKQMNNPEVTQYGLRSRSAGIVDGVEMMRAASALAHSTHMSV